MRYMLLMLLGAFTCFSQPALALADGVAAVVNDGIVLQSEVDDRVSLILRQMNMPEISPERREILARQALADLIDEELQRQEAERLQIRVTQQDLDAAIEIIERNNGMAPGGYAQAVAGLEDVAKRKVVAEIRWQKIITRVVQPKVMISTIEVDRLIDDMLNTQQITERELAQIFISANANETEAEVEQRAKKIQEQVLQGTISFEQAARAYSQDAAAKRGGVMGWFAPNETLPVLERALLNMQPGDVSEPLRGPQGWHILKLLRQRVTQAVSTEPVKELDLWTFHIAKSGDDDTDKEHRKTLAKALRGMDSPEEARSFIDEHLSEPAFAESRYLGWTPQANLPTAQAELLKSTRAGQKTRLVETPVGWVAYYVADIRSRLPEKLKEYRERVHERLLANRVDLHARKLLRELRENSFIDVR